jgi:GMP synthase-like glutamine amidotransferase
MSHGDLVEKPRKDFEWWERVTILPVCVIETKENVFWSSVHPEVSHTAEGGKNY